MTMTPRDASEALDPGAQAVDPLAAARARGRDRAAAILQQPEMLAAAAFGRLMGISPRAVRMRRQRHEILGLESGKGGVRYPIWQLVGRQHPLPGLADLYGALAGSDWAVYSFLLQHHGELGGRTALEALKAGEVDAVQAAARSVASGAFA